MSDSHQAPVHVSIVSTLKDGQPWTTVWVNGVNLTPHIRSVTIEAGHGALADIWLELVGVTVGLIADVPASRVQDITLETAEANLEARLTIDQQRGQRQYGRKGVTPGVKIGLSLWQGPSQEPR